MYAHDPGVFHFREGGRAGPSRVIDRTAGVHENEDVKTRGTRVECGRFDAVVCGQSADEHPFDALVAQLLREPGAVKTAVGVRFPIRSLAYDCCVRGDGQVGMKCRALGVADTMHRPTSVDILWRTRKAAMVRRMPIAGKDDGTEFIEHRVDDGNDGFAVGNRERTPGTKIILYVDYDECVSGLEFDHAAAVSVASSSLRVMAMPMPAMKTEMSGESQLKKQKGA